LIFSNQKIKGKGGETEMKKKTIIGLVLTLGLLLTGTVAYGSWNDRGPHGFNKDGYGCPYAKVDRASYNAKQNTPAARVAMPGRGNWHDKVKWNHDRRYGHEQRPGYRCFRFIGRCR
jgi:hypothetical protein